MTSKRLSLRSWFARSAIVLFGALRFAHWGAPLTGDESYTIRNYAQQPLGIIVSKYNAPNNHLLVSVMLHLLDAASPKKLFLTLADIRLLQFPSIAASILALVLLYLAAAELTGPLAATLAVTAFGVSFWHLMYSHMLRGYSLSVFFNLLNLWLLLRGSKGKTWALFLLPLSLAAAHYLIPVNACYTLALVCWTPYLLTPLDGAARRRGLVLLGLSFAAGAVLTAVAYSPVFGQLLDYIRNQQLDASANSVSNAGRLQEYLSVLGSGVMYQIFFGLVAVYGLLFSLSRTGKWRRAGALMAAYMIIPPLVFALQGTSPGTRVYTSTLPFWALSFAAGLYGAAAAARRTLLLSGRSFQRLTLVAAAATTLLAGGQIAQFWGFFRGIDPVGAMRVVSAETQDTDDFVVIPALPADHRFDGAFILDWTYYAFAAHLYPGYNFGLGQDFPYLMRSKYFILAEDEASAQAALRRGGVDPFLARSLKAAQTLGRIRVFEATLDEGVLKAYRAAVAAPGEAPQARAQAYAGLGYDAIRSGRLAEAVAELKNAQRLAPSDKKIRYLLGWADYLLFDDAHAGDDFEWCAAHDSGNIHASFYNADTLAARGRTVEAARAYRDDDKKHQENANYWMFDDRRKVALDALQGGAGVVSVKARTDDDWLNAAHLFFVRGSYERAAQALNNAIRIKPLSGYYWGLGMVEDKAYRSAAAAKAFQVGSAVGGGSEFRVARAKELKQRDNLTEARAIVSSVLKAEPDNKDALALAAELNRL